mgnify:FL=1
MQEGRFGVLRWSLWELCVVFCGVVWCVGVEEEVVGVVEEEVLVSRRK